MEILSVRVKVIMQNVILTGYTFELLCMPLVGSEGFFQFRNKFHQNSVVFETVNDFHLPQSMDRKSALRCDAPICWRRGLVPFVVSCFFIGSDGEMAIDPHHFRTIMLCVGSITSSVCAVACEPTTRRAGLRIAAKWLLINWGLDILVLVPLMASKEHGAVTLDSWLLTLPSWFTRIGLCYIVFVAVCVVAGECAERSVRKAHVS